MVEGISEEEFTSWKKDIENGLTISQLCKKYDRDFSVIQHRLRNEPSYKKLTTKQREEIKEKYRNGKTITELSKEYNINSSSICFTLKSLIRNKKNKEINRIKKKLNNLSLFEIGYIVGIIEGEGSIFISEENGRYRPVISIANADKVMMNTLDNLLPFFRKSFIKRKNKKWSDIHTIRLNNKKHIKELCNFLYPYMISKKKETELILKIIENNKDKSVVKLLSEIKNKKNKNVKLVN